MKGKSKYLVLLILLLVICSGLVTYALFRTNKSGNANVNAARWNVVFKNGEDTISDNFDISLNNATWTNPLGNVASGKIAPGSSAIFYITVDATNTETDVDYTVEVDESFDESDFEVTLADDSGTIHYSTVEDAMIKQIPIQVIWTGNIDDNNDKNENDLLKRARNIVVPIKITAAQKLPLKNTINFVSDDNVVFTMKLNENTALGSLPSAPIKQDATFLGWYDEDGEEVTINTIPESGTTYYALWIERQYYDKAGRLMYYDPVSENTCNENTFNLTAAVNGTSTCYKWRLISYSQSKMTMQLDHNLVDTVEWNSDTFATHGPLTILTSLANATSKWTRVPLLNYTYNTSASTYNYGSLECKSGTCTITGTNGKINNVRARLITGEEVASVSNNSTWSLSNQSNISNIPSWFVENTRANTNNYGSAIYGYWTLSPSSSSDTFAFFIEYDRTLMQGAGVTVNISSYRGARPVIEINKNNEVVNFNFQDGSQNLVRNYKMFEKYGELPTPSNRENYIFLGWNTMPDGLGIFVDSDTFVSAGTLYAIWQDNTSNEWNYAYNGTDGTNGSIQKFIAPKSGTYKLEIWGPQGGNVVNGNTTTDGGYGGYTSSNITLTQNQYVYLAIGGHPNDINASTTPQGYINGGYNGGGKGIGCYSSVCGASGGGATHVAFTNGLLTTFESNENRANLLLVAAGGGGSGYYGSGYKGGSAGGYIGVKGSNPSGGNPAPQGGTGGTQSTGGTGVAYSNLGGFNGSFGQGAKSGEEASGAWAGGAGGSGLYGGGSGNDFGSAGGGGSSYTKSILTNKIMYCYNCSENSDPNAYTVSTYGTTTHESERDTTACPNGYSFNPISKCAKAGHGYARITFMSE